MDCRDANNQSIILNTDNKNITMRDELKPFWRSYCDQVQQNKESPDEFLSQIKSRAISTFEIKGPEEQFGAGESAVSSLHGGIAQYEIQS